MIELRKAPVDLIPYVVAYFDLLKQRELLAKADYLPITDEKARSLKEAWKEIIEPLYLFRDYFDSGIKIAEYAIEKDFGTLVPADSKHGSGLASSRIRSQFFSDSVVLYAPVDVRDLANTTRNVLMLLMGAAIIFGVLMSNRLVCRGGLDIGIGGEIFVGDGVYGPALYRAYELENSVAGYPRIAIGENVKSFLESARKEASVAAEYGLSLLSRDSDDILILDYFGAGARRFLEPVPEMAIRALAFAYAERDRFVGEGNGKLAERYSLLVQYLERCSR